MSPLVLSLFLCCLTAASFLFVSSSFAAQYGVISTNIANLRGDKSRLIDGWKTSDDQQQSQLLYGECIEIVEEDSGDGWVGVKTVNTQSKFFREAQIWGGYPGFVESWQVARVDACPRRDIVVTARYTPLFTRYCSIYPGCTQDDVITHLSISTLLETCDNNLMNGTRTDGWICVRTYAAAGGRGWVQQADVTSVMQDTKVPLDPAYRSRVLAQVKNFLGQPYLWGGYSARALSRDVSNEWSGSDCSGTVQFGYRGTGIFTAIPRDAHDQFLASRNVSQLYDLEFGDLLFLGSQKSYGTRITHVMLYYGQTEEGEDLLLEATGSCNCTRIVTFETRFGKGIRTVNDLRWNGTTSSGLVFWGTLFADERDSFDARSLLLPLAVVIACSSSVIAAFTTILSLVLLCMFMRQKKQVPHVTDEPDYAAINASSKPLLS